MPITWEMKPVRRYSSLGYMRQLPVDQGFIQATTDLQ
jgi:hypothetical protein